MRKTPPFDFAQGGVDFFLKYFAGTLNHINKFDIERG
jgi:hypothetical protein